MANRRGRLRQPESRDAICRGVLGLPDVGRSEQLLMPGRVMSNGLRRRAGARPVALPGIDLQNLGPACRAVVNANRGGWRKDRAAIRDSPVGTGNCATGRVEGYRDFPRSDPTACRIQAFTRDLNFEPGGTGKLKAVSEFGTGERGRQVNQDQQCEETGLARTTHKSSL